jgi:MscS family membrane protein
MDMPPWLLELTAWAGENRWMVWIALILIATAVIDAIQRLVFRGLNARARKTRNDWDDAILWAIPRPFGFLVWVLGVTLAVTVASEYVDLDTDLVDYVNTVCAGGVILALAWFALRLIRAVEQRMVTRVQAVSLEPDQGADRSTVEMFGKLARALILLAALLMLLQTAGISVSGVLAFGGLGGIVIGFAARDMLANFFGGIMLHLDRPLAVGEWVRSPDREIEGTVEYISWRNTRLRTFDMRPLYVPNATFSTIIVENPSRMSHRRIYETVGVRYGDIAAMPAIVEDTRSMLLEHEAIDSAASLIVNFVDFGDSSLDFMVYCLTQEKRWVQYHAIKQEIMLRIAGIIADHGAEIAFPTETLHVASVPGGEPTNAAGQSDNTAAQARESERVPGQQESRQAGNPAAQYGDPAEGEGA